MKPTGRRNTLWEGRGQERNIGNVARRKLWMLDDAETPSDVAVVPGNRLAALKKARKGQYSIRINDQWRICFLWREGGADDVEIVDYH